MPYDFTTWDRNCEVEQESPLAPTSVTGSVPAWLRGSFILNGPGKMKYGTQEFNHVFDGASILQKFSFQENGPVYTSRFLRTNAYQLNTESQQIVVSEFGTKGCASEHKGFLKKFGNKFSMDKLFSDNAQLNLAKYGGDLYANTEAPFLFKIDPNTLETLEKIDLLKDLGIASQCPHPIRLEDGSNITIFNATGPTGPRYDLVSIPSSPLPGKDNVFAKPSKIASVDARWKLNPCLVHSFGITENYLVVAEQPFTVDIMSIVANTMKDRPMIEGMEWKENKQVKLHLIQRNGGKELKIKYKSKEPFFFLNIINCFEDNGHVVVDLVSFPKPELLHFLFLKKLRSLEPDFWKTQDPGRNIRLVLPVEINEKSSPDQNLVTLSSTKAAAHRQKDGLIVLTPEVKTNICYENPVINDKFRGKKYSFTWGLSGDLSQSSGKVGKVDLRTGDVKIWSRDNVYAAAISFVPRPGSEAEDDGVIVANCLCGGSEKSKTVLAVLDAATMEELYFATFTTASDSSRALHGKFLQ